MSINHLNFNPSHKCKLWPVWSEQCVITPSQRETQGQTTTQMFLAEPIVSVGREHKDKSPERAA